MTDRASERDISEGNRIRDQLAEREEDLRVLFETMPIGWAEHEMVFDSDGRPCDYIFLRVNSAFERFTGLARDAIVGERVTDFIPGIRDAKPDLISLYGEVVTTGEQRKFDLYFPPFNRWYGVTAFRRRPGTFVVMLEDITERKVAEQSADEQSLKVRMFLENTADLVTVVDADGRFRYLNKAAKVVYGSGPDELLGVSAFDFIHPEDRDSTQQAFGEWLAARVPSASWENRQVSVTGELRDMLWTIMPRFVNGELESIWSIARDITDRKRAEQALKDVNESLARSNKDLEQFAYVASHDLQEPLRMVASYTQLLAERYEGKLDAKADKYIGYAVDGAKRMQGLINDLLAYSRVGTRGGAPVLSDCNEAVRDTLRSLERVIHETEAQITVNKLPTVIADPSQLRQLFQNLIGNAIKFHRERPARVEISAKRVGAMWELCVSDNGIGIDPQFHDRVFVIFQRLHERGRYDGSGIGLAIVKKIVERHGGAIRIDSAPDMGTKFLFTLPAENGTGDNSDG